MSLLRFKGRVQRKGVLSYLLSHGSLYARDGFFSSIIMYTTATGSTVLSDSPNSVISGHAQSSSLHFGKGRLGYFQFFRHDFRTGVHLFGTLTSNRSVEFFVLFGKGLSKPDTDLTIFSALYFCAWFISWRMMVDQLEPLVTVEDPPAFEIPEREATFLENGRSVLFSEEHGFKINMIIAIGASRLIVANWSHICCKDLMVLKKSFDFRLD